MGGIFNAETTPLDNSFLLEASAGTGKTYSLVKIVTRLIRDEGIPIDKILVVTFTNKAAAEMKNRIREGLRQIVKETGNKNCRMALDHFDEAPVYTIHGFCQQVLSRWPLESGMPFQIELQNSQSDNDTKELISDYLMNLQSSLSSDPVLNILYSAARKSGNDFSGFFHHLNDFILKWNKLFAGDTYPDAESCRHILDFIHQINSDFSQVSDCFSRLANSVPDEKELSKISKQTPGKGSAPKTCLAFVDNLKKMAEWKSCEIFFSEAFSKEWQAVFNQIIFQFNPENTDFKDSEWASKVSDFITFFDPFLDPFQSGKSGWLNNAFLALLFNRKVAMDLSADIRKKRISAGTPGFDDLIYMTHNLVCRESGANRLSDALRNQYSLALIDEFQDTDSFQWEIFSTLFLCPSHRLFLIGDPKQSIYSFRNADLNIYYKAAEQMGIKAIFRLDTNYRSTRPMVNAVNRICQDLFMQPSRLSRSPGFEPVNSGKETDIEYRKSTPVTFFDLDADESIDDPYAVIAIQIADLLNNPKDSHICPGDIAYLSDRYQELNAVQDQLNQLGIPSVLYEDKSINDSNELELLCDILAAAVYPGKSGYLKKLLTSPFYPLPSHLVLEMEETGGFAPWQIMLTQVRGKLEKGRLFDAVFDIFNCGEILKQSLTEKEIEEYQLSELLDDFRIRVLRRPGGSRISTNLMHLLEIIQGVWKERGFTPEELLEELKGDAFSRIADEEKNQRLDSDSNAVQLMTMFKSKGLEFPVVFFSSFRSHLLVDKSDYRLFNRQGKQCRLMLNAADYREEEMDLVWQERLRLIYVCFTRASKRMYLPYSSCGNYPFLSSIMARLNWSEFLKEIGEDQLKRDDRNRIVWPLERSSGKVGDFKTALGKALDISLGKLTEENPELFSISRESLRGKPYLPSAEDDISGIYHPEHLPFANRILPVSSFTSLSASREINSDDYDKDYNREEPETNETSIGEEDPVILLPGGVDFGQMIHSLFEEMDWKSITSNKLPDEQNELLDKIVTRFYSPVWLRKNRDAVLQLLKNTLNTSLSEANCTLSDIPAGKRKAEIEFLLNCRKEGIAVLNGERYLLDDGMLKGYIDLVFEAGGRYFLADWKTNRPGAGRALSDYNQTSVNEIMNHHQYKLQYYLYLSALVPYLEEIEPEFDYERDFGGVYYFFVRGMHSWQSNGIYFDRPSYREIQEFAEGFREIIR